MSDTAADREKARFTAEPGKRTMVLTREFDAPRQLVWDASTKAEHLVHWWGGSPGSNLAICEVDLRPGGAYRFVERAPDGHEFTFRGKYLEIDPPHRLVQTMLLDADGWRDRILTTTLVLEEKNGRTQMTETSEFMTVEDRDAYVKAGAKAGALRSLNRMAEYLATH